ncbi:MULTISPECIES: DUF6894 family protein [unclassified Bradyrhizobium]|uniref:DUF6894 family protein n=1 Tax=unclassified Bradyrhizobium TaxID=2631580 RepID=UPI0020B411A8|nr:MULTISPECIES: tRNA 5-methylaminomethyl-2-thiouridine synthase [unclassified Bradyrhizobium]MCP3402071.1 tRNA 5-methylaminomethyl-2-thiouridine synthase [Bradyrhizobium sp. CCGB20]MCP3410559.1 tRNA 5-methylaminomethyl-2-thiouridine synthase [Bradyrhizobium sp. CCGB01]
MTRYFYQITNGAPHNDDVGEELANDHAAWIAAKRLARDIEDSLELDGRWSLEVRDGIGPVCSITIESKKLR